MPAVETTQAAKFSPALRVTQVRSAHGRTEYQQRVVRGLGLRGVGSSVVVANTPSFRGMIKRVLHLVVCEDSADLKSTADKKAGSRVQA